MAQVRRTKAELRELLQDLLASLDEDEKESLLKQWPYQPIIATNSIVTYPTIQPKQPKISPLQKVELMQRLDKANAARKKKRKR